MDCNRFLTDLVKEFPNNTIRNLRTKLFALRKEEIEKVFLFCSTSSGIDCSETPFLISVVKDMCIYKINSLHNTKEVNSNKQYLVINFVNRLVEQIKLKEIILSARLLQAFPVDRNINGFREPCISFQYSSTIRSKVVNYKQAIKEVVSCPALCNCSNYDNRFIDPHHKHVFTGDLAIVENNGLNSLLRKGLNYREQQPPNKTEAYNSIISAIDIYIHKMSVALNKPIASFNEWRNNILEESKRRLDNIRPYRYNKVLYKDSEEDIALKKLQKDFVFVPVDKAGNNIAVICKYYYISILTKELSSANFSEINTTQGDILHSHKQFLDKFSMNVEDKYNQLPFLYFTAKMHKIPVDSRFITSAKFSSLSELSAKVGMCLKGLLNCSKHYSMYDSKYHKHLKNYYIIDNNTEVIKFLENSNNLKDKHKSMATYDFKTLYTSIPHNLLKEKIKCFVERVFRRKGKKFIIPTKSGAYFTNKRNTKGWDSSQLVNCINFIVDNSYVVFTNKIFRQIIGIPMGTNCAPYLANIFLHMFEIEFVDNLNANSKSKVSMLLNNIFRYQDDCLVLNDCKQFVRYLDSIYPEEMVLENTNVNHTESNYLDLNITLNNGKFSYKSYDKREDYAFEVIKYPDLSGNIPSGPAYGVFISQCKRFTEVNCTLENFITDIKSLQSRLVKQGFSSYKLQDRFKTFANNNIYLWSKFGQDIRSEIVVNKIFDI